MRLIRQKLFADRDFAKELNDIREQGLKAIKSGTFKNSGIGENYKNKLNEYEDHLKTSGKWKEKPEEARTGFDIRIKALKKAGLKDSSDYWEKNDNYDERLKKIQGYLKERAERIGIDPNHIETYGIYNINKVKNYTPEQKKALKNYRALYKKAEKGMYGTRFDEKLKKKTGLDIDFFNSISKGALDRYNNIVNSRFEKESPEMSNYNKAKKVDLFRTDDNYDYKRLKLADYENSRENKKHLRKLVDEEMKDVPKYRKNYDVKNPYAYEKYNPETKQWEKIDDIDFEKDSGIMIDPREIRNCSAGGNWQIFGDGGEHRPFTVLHEGIKKSGHTYKFNEFNNHLEKMSKKDPENYDSDYDFYHGIPIEELRADNNIIRYIKSHPDIPNNAKKQMVRQAKNYRDAQLKYGYGFNREKEREKRNKK